MDETTFNDPQIADFIDENYIAIKIDVDHFDGLVWKEQYNIKISRNLWSHDQEEYT